MYDAKASFWENAWQRMFIKLSSGNTCTVATQYGSLNLAERIHTNAVFAPWAKTRQTGRTHAKAQPGSRTIGRCIIEDCGVAVGVMVTFCGGSNAM